LGPATAKYSFPVREGWVKDIILLVAAAILGGFVTIVISRPSVRFSIVKPLEMRMFGNGVETIFTSLRIYVSNEARWWTLLAQLYQLTPSNDYFWGVPARKRESNQRRPIANRV
jgi:hypothetical protein